MSDELAIRSLYADLLGRWNARDAAAFAALFASDGGIVGFDGTTVEGPPQVAAHLQQVFAHHATASYVGKVRSVHLLGRDAGLLQAVAGMVPPGQTSLNPAVNAVQSLVVVRAGEAWRIALFQNTPAAYHGRPEASAALTAELQALLPS